MHVNCGVTALCRWLSKKGQKGLIKSYKSRWFKYEDAYGLLRYYKKDTDHVSLG